MTVKAASTERRTNETIGSSPFRVGVIAESDLNDARLVSSQELAGYGLDAQWNDDFHHALHTLLTGERAGYYEDFGRVQDLAKAFAEGFVYSGGYSPARRWGREEQVAAIFHFGDTTASVTIPLPHGRWLKRLASGDERWNRPGPDLPAELHSDGKVSVTLTKQAFLIVNLQPED